MSEPETVMRQSRIRQEFLASSALEVWMLAAMRVELSNKRHIADLEKYKQDTPQKIYKLTQVSVINIGNNKIYSSFCLNQLDLSSTTL